VSGSVTPGVGETFGGYTIESVLGRGGMGTVFLATHERLARKVALKVITPQLAHDEDFRARFHRESQLAASLDHPNAIPIYDAAEVDGVPYLAMRYVRGPSLQTLIREHGLLSPPEVLRIAAQIGGALDAAHRAGLIHRDVKPANILVAEPGDHAYLCDFGLARRTSSEGMTQTGFFLGTVDYCAPEQIQGGPLDGRADIYSLGCVLFHCLAGEPPYVRDSEFAVLQAHLADPPPALSSIQPDLPRALDSVLATAMAKDPDARYTTGEALAAAVRQALSGAAGEPTRVAPTAAVAPTRRLTRPRHRRWLVAIVVVLALAGALAGVLATQGSHGGVPPEKLRTFVDRIENVLRQSAEGRHEIGAALTAGMNCKISPRNAALRVASVAENRQTILVQLGSFATPTQQTDEIVTILQQALQQSIEADRHYRDGFLSVASTACPLRLNQDFKLGARTSAEATATKRRFVTAFDPLAQRFHRSTWSTGEF
jgi:serine/threonine-protein kinase